MYHCNANAILKGKFYHLEEVEVHCELLLEFTAAAICCFSKERTMTWVRGSVLNSCTKFEKPRKSFSTVRKLCILFILTQGWLKIIIRPNVYFIICEYFQGFPNLTHSFYSLKGKDKIFHICDCCQSAIIWSKSCW